MNHYVCFISGIICMIIILKMLIPQPIIKNVYPTLSNYKDITYVDDLGRTYKYELIKVK